MTSPVVVVLAAALTGGAALALTDWMRALARVDSRWLDRPVHVLLAGLGGGAAAVYTRHWFELAAFGVLGVACALLVVIDLATYRLPDAIVGPTYPLLFTLLAAAAATGGGWDRLLRAAAAAGLSVLAYLLVALARPDLGLGDVKLSGLLGGFLGWLGWSQLMLGTLLAFALAAVFAAGLLLTRRATRRSDFAFAPWMVLGAVLGAVWGGYAPLS